MANRILLTIIFLALVAATSLTAQETQQKNWNTEKIKGMRFIPYPPYSGTPYFNEKFILGEIEFTGGTKIKNIGLRYSSFRDELIYYNTDISTQIVIDKITLKGFSFTDELGLKHIFRRQYFDLISHEERFFEVLSDGKIALLAFRKADLETCDTSFSKYGLAYQPSSYFYIYHAERGYSPIKINRSSLLTKFTKPNQKLVKKLLRKNSVQIADEQSFIAAWNLVVKNDIPVTF